MPNPRARVPASVGAVLAAAMSFSSPASGEDAAPADAFAAFMSDMRVGLELGVENFRWQEFNDQGGRLLSEHGMRYGAGGTLDNLGRDDAGVLAVFSGRGYSGRVEYDGQDTRGRFMATRSVYSGYALEAGGGYRFIPNAHSPAFDVIAGIGFDRWERDIRGGVNSVGAPVSGFVETYTVVHARLGIGLFHLEGALPGYLSAGLRRPLYIDEDIVVNGQALELAPENNASAFVSYRVSLAPARDGRPFGRYLRASYDSYRLGRSPAITAGNLSVWQPDSHMDVFSLSLGVTFY